MRLRKRDEINEECINVLNYLKEFSLFLLTNVFDEVIMVDTNRIFKGPDLYRSEFLRFVSI